MTRTKSCQTRSRAVANPPNPAGTSGPRQPIIHQSTIINPNAFTLVELLVVISVITLLMALLLPALQRSRKQARAVVCRANLRQWGILLKGYTGTSDGGLHNQGFCQIAAPEFWMYWLTRNAPGTEKVRFCPMATKPAFPPGTPNPIDPRVPGGRYRAWGRFRPYASRTLQLNALYSGSYSINNWLAACDNTGSWIIGVAGSPMRNATDCFWGSENVKGAADIPAFGDALWWCAWPKDTDRPPRVSDDTEPFPCGCGDSMRRFCVNRHDGYVNMAFLDGSVRRVGLKQLWTLKWHRNYKTANRWTKAGGAQSADWPEWMRQFKDY